MRIKWDNIHKYLAQCWTQRKHFKNAIILTVTLTITTILRYKLPEIDVLSVIEAMVWSTQHPLQPFLKPTALDSFITRVLHMTQVLLSRYTCAPGQ